MFFKKLSSLLLVMSLISSCSWLRDKPKVQNGFQTDELNLSCLQDAPSQLQNLFAGHYSESEKDQNSVKAIWRCLDRSLNTFSKYTHGSNAAYYADSELQEFANRYLPKDNQFNKPLINSIFKLKTAVLGGNEQNINQEEIQKLRTKLARFGEMILPLAPYISTLLKPTDDLSNEKIKNARITLNKFIADVSILLEDSENTVKWADISSFMVELEKYLKSPNPTALTMVAEQIQVFQYLKMLIVGGDEFGIEKSKWQPIFKSISASYNAIYLTKSNSEMMEQLGIEVQSTDEEQRKATEKLTGVLKVLKNNPDLNSKASIQLIADRWSKALLANAFFFPKNQNKLAVQSFLSSPALRSIIASLIDEATQVRNGDQSVKLITKITENLSLLIDQAGVDQNAPINLANLRDFASQLKPLFSDETTYQIIDSSLAAFQDVATLLIGKDSGILTTKDLRTLIQKGTDLYVAWKGEGPVNFNKAIASSLSIIIRQPNAYMISIEQIQGLLKKCETLFSKLNFNSTIDWSKINKMVINGAKLKSILFANTDQSISNYELTQIQNAWSAFGTGNIDDGLNNLTSFFKNNPFSSVKIDALVNSVDSFLPDDKKLSKLGMNSDLIGSIKSFLIGGQASTLDRSEFSKLSKVGFTIYKNLKPIINTLPSDYKMGLNSATFSLMEAGIQGLIDDKELTLSNSALKQLMLSQLSKPGKNIRPQTIDQLLMGLNFRVLDNNKGTKPLTYPATFESSKLTGLKKVFEKTKLDFQDFENSFAGVNNSSTLDITDIAKKLTRADSKKILNSLQPIMNGQTNMPYFTAHHGPQTDYYLIDLYFKDVIYHALMWAFPAYEIEKDNSKPNSMPRLSMNDLIDLFNDINDTVYDLGLSFSPDSATESATKRMQSINLFTRTGNGDEYIDVIETVDFLTTTLAGKNLLDEVRQTLVDKCYPHNFAYLSQDSFSYSCIKNELFGKSQFSGFYQKVIPLMTDHYLSLNDSQRDDFRKSALSAVRPGWKEDSMMDLSDLETLVSIPYYIENIFLRLDHNYDGTLSFTEAMSGFPIFCREIKKAGGTSIKGSCETGEDPRQVEAIYGYLLMKGEAPKSIQPGDSIWDKAMVAKDFLIWLYTWNHLDRNPAVRDRNPPYIYRKDLLNIISNLSKTIAPPPSPAQPLKSASSY